MVRSTLLYFSGLGGIIWESPRFYEFVCTKAFKPRISRHSDRLLEGSRIIILEGIISFTGVISNVEVDIKSFGSEGKISISRGQKIKKFEISENSEK